MLVLLSCFLLQTVSHFILPIQDMALFVWFAVCEYCTVMSEHITCGEIGRIIARRDSVNVSDVCFSNGCFCRFFHDKRQPDCCKLSVLLTFHINNTPIWRLVDFAYAEASIDYMALGI